MNAPRPLRRFRWLISGSPDRYARPMRAVLGLLAIAFVGCQTYQDDLSRAQHEFEHNEHEHALAILPEKLGAAARIESVCGVHLHWLAGVRALPVVSLEGARPVYLFHRRPVHVNA